MRLMNCLIPKGTRHIVAGEHLVRFIGRSVSAGARADRRASGCELMAGQKARQVNRRGRRFVARPIPGQSPSPVR